VENTVLILFVVGLLLSFFLSGMESGVFALSRLRIRHYVRQGQRRARVLHEYLEKPESFLWTILIGNTLAAVAVVSIGVRWLHQWLAPNWLLLTLSLAAGTLIYYAAFELLPKTLFRLFPNRLCLALALPFRAVYVVLRPLVTLLAIISRSLLRWSGGQRFTGRMFGNREELRMVMQESGQGLSTEERSMINRVLDLQVLSAAAITTPWEKLIVFSTDTPVAEALARARAVGFASVPVWRKEEKRQRIAGLIDLSALLYSDTVNMAGRVGDYLQPALYLDESTRLEVALRQMQRTGQRLAIVLGRDGSEVGTVTLHDILNVIFSGMQTQP
jgi:CBS domain containing-hemolysin-like protein